MVECRCRDTGTHTYQITMYKPQIESEEKLVFGKLSASISGVIEQCPEYFDGDLVVTLADSTPLTSDMYEGFFQLHLISFRPHTSSLLIHRASVHTFLKHFAFYGFDELYVIRNLEEVPRDLKLAHFTTDRYNFNQTVPAEFVEAFQKLGAINFLADGFGTNFACKADLKNKMLRLDGFE